MKYYYLGGIFLTVHFGQSAGAPPCVLVYLFSCSVSGTQAILRSTGTDCYDLHRLCQALGIRFSMTHIL